MKKIIFILLGLLLLEADANEPKCPKKKKPSSDEIEKNPNHLRSEKFFSSYSSARKHKNRAKKNNVVKIIPQTGGVCTLTDQY